MEATEEEAVNEVRRLDIVYFICRKGHNENPHLICVHHLSHNDVRLHDVKRWLSELRGKDMPQSYAWSCKRKYKSGFVWQDLLDEDLITPISDNEYVLKGSEISNVTSDNGLSQFCDVKEGIKLQEVTLGEEQESATSMLAKPMAEIEEQSSINCSDSSMSDDSLKLEHKNHLNSRKAKADHKCLENEAEEEVETEELREKAPFILKDKKKLHLKNFIKAKICNRTLNQSPSSSSKDEFSKSRRYSNNASSLLRKLITCGAVDTNDSCMMANKQKSTSTNDKHSKLDALIHKGNRKMAEIYRGDIFGGSKRMSRNLWFENHESGARKSCDGGRQSKHSEKNQMNGQNPVLHAYKPRNGPYCSQCRKAFDPMKLHKHMKSCSGMKALAKAAAATTPSTFSPHKID